MKSNKREIRQKQVMTSFVSTMNHKSASARFALQSQVVRHRSSRSSLTTITTPRQVTPPKVVSESFETNVKVVY